MAGRREEEAIGVVAWPVELEPGNWRGGVRPSPRSKASRAGRGRFGSPLGPARGQDEGEPPVDARAMSSGYVADADLRPEPRAVEVERLPPRRLDVPRVAARAAQHEEPIVRRPYRDGPAVDVDRPDDLQPLGVVTR